MLRHRLCHRAATGEPVSVNKAVRPSLTVAAACRVPLLPETRGRPAALRWEAMGSDWDVWKLPGALLKPELSIVKSESKLCHRPGRRVWGRPWICIDNRENEKCEASQIRWRAQQRACPEAYHLRAGHRVVLGGWRGLGGGPGASCMPHVRRQQVSSRGKGGGEWNFEGIALNLLFSISVSLDTLLDITYLPESLVYIYIRSAFCSSVVRYTTILKRGSPWAPAEELFQDKVLADAGRPADWAELRPWLGVRGQG